MFSNCSIGCNSDKKYSALRSIAIASIYAFLVLAGNVGFSSPAQAITAGTACSTSIDNSQGETAPTHDSVAYVILTSAASCQSGNGNYGSGYVPTIFTLVLNSNNDGTPVWLDNFSLKFNTAITNVRINSTPTASGYLQSFSGVTTLNIEYTYGGQNYHFTTSIDPINHTIGSFVVMAGNQASSTNSTINANQTSIVADGASTSTVTVQLVDSNGNNLTAGGDTVVLATTAGSLSAVTDNNNGTYTATLTSSTTVGTATITGTVNGAAMTDNASVSFTPPDATSPTVQILNAPEQHDRSTAFNVTIEFSENVVGFVQNDISVSEATLSNFIAVDGNTFTVDVIPSGPRDVSINIAAGVATDNAGNPNTAAEQVTVKSSIIEDTQRAIASFMFNRANHILNNQPDLTGFVNGRNLVGQGLLGNLNLHGNEEGLTLAFSTSRSKILAAQAKSRIDAAFRADARSRKNPLVSAEGDNLTNTPQHILAYADKGGAGSSADAASLTGPRAGTWDIWTEVYGSSSNAGRANSSIWVGYLGMHYFTSENQLIGVVGQLDWADEDNSSLNSKADGFGWMIGPYIAGQFSDQNLYYEARVSYGQSDNNISPIGTYTDSFNTERWLVTGKISGVYEYTDLTIRPEVRVSWYEETQETYTDSLSNIIPEQTISLGELRFGPTIQRTLLMDNGLTLTPEFALSGVWNFDVENGSASQPVPIGDDDLRARVDLGLAAANPYTGVSVSISGYYDGIGVADYDAWGGKASVNVPLH